MRVRDLGAQLERLIESPHWRRDEWSVMVVSLDGGDTIFAHQPGHALAPASNMKLFTSAAALYYLGPDFRYQTYLAAAGPIRDGVLDGDLVLYGTGDPTISDRLYPSKTTVWEELADTLLAHGIREVRGDVVGDASYFTGLPVGIGWRMEDINTWYAAPASALTFGEAMVTLRIMPGKEVGWRPRFQLVPGGDGIAIVNQATTVPSGRTRIEATRAGYDGPILVKGQMARGHGTVWRAVPVPDPARYAAATFDEVLRNRGIRVTGRFRSVNDSLRSSITGRRVFAPALTHGRPVQVIAVHHSPPLLDILTVLNKKSHNLYAEQLLRTVGRVTAGVGSMESGREAVVAMLGQAPGEGQPELRMLDGSGLSELNRVNAATVVRLLTFLSTKPYFEQFLATLPEAGGVGLHRMHRTAAEGNLRAKTGTIDSVSALSGYVRAADGERLVFSIISNRVGSTWRAKRVEDAIGARLAGFTRPIPPGGGGAPARMLARADSIESERRAVRRAGPPFASVTLAANDSAPAAAARRTPAPAVTAARAQPAGSVPGAAAPLDVASLPSARLPLSVEAPTPARHAAVAVAAPPESAAAPPAAPAPERRHRVARGETLSEIAQHYGVSLEALKAANPDVTPRRLQLGQSLSIPGEDAEPGPPATDDVVPESGRAPEQEAATSPRTYKVRAGDTFDGIARRYGITVPALRQANPGIEPRRLQVGQTLRVPSGR